MSDEEGKSQTKYFKFTVSTHVTTNANDATGITIPYEVNISDIELANEPITLEEMIYSGAKIYKEGNTYLTITKHYWTMSPAGLNASNAYAWMGYENNGTITSYDVSGIFIVRPVINLKNDVLVTGTGTSENMWKIQ